MTHVEDIRCPACNSENLRGRRRDEVIHLTCADCSHEWDRTPSASCPRCATSEPIEDEKWGWEFHDREAARDNPMAGYDDVLRVEYRCKRCHHTWQRELARKEGRSTRPEPEREPRLAVTSIGVSIRSVVQLEGWSYGWPDAVENFDRAWELEARLGLEWRKLRHCIGRRVCFGRSRVHSVTFVDGAPRVEGAEAEDYGKTQALVSVAKRGDGRDALHPNDLPSEYQELVLVTHSDEIYGPMARRGLAVKIRQDDLDSWALHALLRVKMKGV